MGKWTTTVLPYINNNFKPSLHPYLLFPKISFYTSSKQNSFSAEVVDLVTEDFNSQKNKHSLRPRKIANLRFQIIKKKNKHKTKLKEHPSTVETTRKSKNAFVCIELWVVIFPFSCLCWNRESTEGRKKNLRSWNLKQETWGFTSTAVHFQLYSKSKSAMMKANLWSEIKAFSRSIEGLNPALIKWQVLRAVDLRGLLC